MQELLHGETSLLGGLSAVIPEPQEMIGGGISSAIEEEELAALNEWVSSKNLPSGMLAFEVSDLLTGQPVAILDLAWPNGIQEGLSQPVAVLLNESAQVLGLASSRGYRCFTSVKDFRQYVVNEIFREQST